MVKNLPAVQEMWITKIRGLRATEDFAQMVAQTQRKVEYKQLRKFYWYRERFQIRLP